MNESWVSLQGWVGGEVTTREVHGVPVATFRLGCTPRYLKGDTWVDGTTSWYTVHAWRALARNVAASVHKGDAVLVHGRLRTEVWEREGQPPSTSSVVDATYAGHDLTKGTSRFLRTGRPERPDAPVETRPGPREVDPAAEEVPAA